VTELVSVETVPSETEAEVVCEYLRTAGIKCGHRESDNTAAGFMRWREILVGEEDAVRAREVLAAKPSGE
jgi:hypothetical protein